jgi:hypothetical protein
MGKLNEGTRLLRAYLPGEDGAAVMRLALDVGVSPSTVYRWLSGKVPKSRAVRMALARTSEDRIPAAAWDRTS